jgi:hypothetical protein
LATADELWLGVFQRLCDATAHQFKGALNGVAVNLEVVRSRAGRSETDAVEIRPFAEAAAAELESVIQSAEAMLALARTPRGQADVARITRDVAVLASRSAPAEEGKRLTVDKGVERLGTTSAPASAARLAIAAVLMAALEVSKDVVCSAAGEGGAVAIRVACGERDGSSFALSDEVVSTAYSAGVHLDISESGATITFPT